MRVTIKIAAKDLKEIQRITARKKKSPARFELLSGVKAEEESDLEQAFTFSHHVPFEPDDWRAAALLERQLRSRRLTLPRNDLFVGVVAIRTGLSLACRDMHFDAMREVAGTKLVVEQI